MSGVELERLKTARLLELRAELQVALADLNEHITKVGDAVWRCDVLNRIAKAASELIVIQTEMEQEATK